MVTGDNESPNLIPEFLTGRMPSRTALNQPARDHNDLLDTTLAATERTHYRYSQLRKLRNLSCSRFYSIP